MKAQRDLVGLLIGLAAVAGATAQSAATLRWRTGNLPLGLQAGHGDVRAPCGNFAFSCSDAATVPLYSSDKAPRSIAMQVGYAGTGMALRNTRTPGLNVSLVGQAGIGGDVGVYGRVGTTVNRAAPALTGVSAGEGGLTYGAGLSWDFSRSASAAVGLDSRDVRGAAGDVRNVRTSLGLQWRY
jgi:hypothetical protein